jgi:hypothetical protein
MKGSLQKQKSLSATIMGLKPSALAEIFGKVPIRAVFKDAFTCAGLSYFNPHSFCNTLTQLGVKECKTFERQKAWGQKLGRENVVTINSHGALTRGPREEIMRAMRDLRL